MESAFFCCNFDTDSSGVSIQFTRRRNVLLISGWYDHIVGIRRDEVSLTRFFERLGITKKDCLQAFGE